MDVPIPEISSFFQLEEPSRLIPLQQGHIHRSWIYQIGDGPGFVLQQINSRVFERVDIIHENIMTLLDEFKFRDVHWPVKLVPGREGNGYYCDGKIRYWRLWNYIPDTRTFPSSPDPLIASGAGYAVSQFDLYAYELSVEKFHEVIPKFHSLKWRLKQLREAVEEGLQDRVDKSNDQLEDLEKFIPFTLPLEEALETGQIRKQIVHNDAKLSNVLFDKKNQWVCMIDLDTVMPGSIHFDFGDCARSLITSRDESDTDFDGLSIEKEHFEAFVSGYLHHNDKISQNDLDFLPLSVIYMPLIMAIRFLTDFLKGDQYYQISYETQNYDRARSQLALCHLVEREYEYITRKIVESRDK